MSAELSGNPWLYSYNPCGTQTFGGLEHKTCVSEACGNTTCLAKIAFQMAGHLINTGTIPEQEEEYIRHELSSHLGSRVVLPIGKVTELDAWKIDTIVGIVSKRAQLIVKGVRECEANTLPLSEEVLRGLTDEQKETLGQLGNLGDQMRDFIGDREQAVDLITLTKEVLNRAIDLGLQKIGVVARQALWYGLADKVGKIESTGLLHSGDLNGK